jgi:hypothetical protein
VLCIHTLTHTQLNPKVWGHNVPTTYDHMCSIRKGTSTWDWSNHSVSIPDIHCSCPTPAQCQVFQVFPIFSKVHIHLKQAGESTIWDQSTHSVSIPPHSTVGRSRHPGASRYAVASHRNSAVHANREQRAESPLSFPHFRTTPWHRWATTILACHGDPPAHGVPGQPGPTQPYVMPCCTQRAFQIVGRHWRLQGLSNTVRNPGSPCALGSTVTRRAIETNPQIPRTAISVAWKSQSNLLQGLTALSSVVGVSKGEGAAVRTSPCALPCTVEPPTLPFDVR